MVTVRAGQCQRRCNCGQSLSAGTTLGEKGQRDDGGDGGIRTLTGGGLSALPLPIGLRPPRLVSVVVR